MPAWVEEFLTLVGLAASIRTNGLINPITVNHQVDRYIIETGERRWLAHHLLLAEVGNEFAKIPAQEVLEINLWRQADENGNRRPLNAIGMARQIALLIMDMYEHEDQTVFQPYEALVRPGECDRAYYAQVSNGYTYKVKDGYLDKMLKATGLPSSRVLSAYRALLRVDDDLWIKADRDSWPEKWIRDEQDSRRNPVKHAESLPQGKHPDDESLPDGKHHVPETGGIERFLGEKPDMQRPARTDGMDREQVDAYYDEAHLRRSGPTWDDPEPEPPVELEYVDDDDDYDPGEFAGHIPAADASPVIDYHMRGVIGKFADLALQYNDRELALRLQSWRDMTKKQVQDQLAVAEGGAQLAQFIHELMVDLNQFLMDKPARQIEQLAKEQIRRFME
ncbi:ParB N-terminal domain-containing protein [Phototrophicus methaneseepsis]|uniref:ParB N-terminal domain-containing protein n=2 Tax=Phototrophicus methaneseepsis TaxID=2710758 RepID=A0A7S8IFY7_9CHLR|nr:ParB N-terminal domain-containing protein [Phototrophicus methaneseepsis]